MRILAALVLICCNLQAGDPAKPYRLPEPPVKVQPMPQPGASVQMKVNDLYVFESKEPLIIRPFPQGSVVVEVDDGPVLFKSEKLVYGNGQLTSKKFTEKFVYTIKGTHKGKCEVAIIPKKAEIDDKDIDVIPFEVDGDAAPNPVPPKPVPVPDEPETDADKELVKSLQVAIEKDADKESAKKLATLYSTAELGYQEQWGRFVERMKRESDKQGIPRLPALLNTRSVISEYLGKYDVNSYLDEELRKQTNAKIKTLTASLKEATK